MRFWMPKWKLESSYSYVNEFMETFVIYVTRTMLCHSVLNGFSQQNHSIFQKNFKTKKLLKSFKCYALSQIYFRIIFRVKEEHISVPLNKRNNK